MQPAIEIRGVSKAYGSVRALADISMVQNIQALGAISIEKSNRPQRAGCAAIFVADGGVRRLSRLRRLQHGETNFLAAFSGGGAFPLGRRDGRHKIGRAIRLDFSRRVALLGGDARAADQQSQQNRH